MKEGTVRSGGAGMTARATRRSGLERLHERLVEIVNVRKILAAVGLGFAEDIVFDQIEDDVAEVGAAADAPGGEDGLGQRARLLQGLGAGAFEEVRPGPMLAVA